MNPKYVTSLELSKQLKEAGIPQVSQYAWTNVDEMGEEQPDWILTEDGDGEAEWLDDGHYISAFHVGELGEMLPSEMKLPVLDNEEGGLTILKMNSWYVGYCRQGKAAFPQTCIAKNEAESRGLMLLYLKQNDLL